MDRKLWRQRLVGVVTLAVVVGIVFPFLLPEAPSISTERTTPPQGQPDTTADTTVEIAPPPDEEVFSDPTSALPLPQISAPETPAPAPNPVALSPKAASPPAPEKQTEARTSGQWRGQWVVQLGSFSNEKNALSLRDQLRAAGYNAFVEHVNEGMQENTVRVRVGPEVERHHAEALQKRLREERNLHGLIVRLP